MTLLTHAQEARLLQTRSRRGLRLTDSQSVFRIARLVVLLQTLALAIDHPSIRLPRTSSLDLPSPLTSELTDIALCYGLLKGPLFYSLHFFSRPLLDLLFLLRHIYDSSSSGYSSSTAAYIDWEVTDPLFWHTIQRYWHLLAAWVFALLAVLFTLFYWNICDYSDQNEIRGWLSANVNRAWLVRGAGGVLLRLLQMAVGCVALVLLALGIASDMSSQTLSDSRVTGGLVAVAVSFVVVGFVISALCLSSVRSLFLKYASQSTDHTSAIILKEVLKSKMEIGILLMLAVLMPALDVFTQSTMVITDWNDATAAMHRVASNYYVPCYLWALPPYRTSFAATNRTCSFASSLDPVQLASFPGTLA